MGSSCSFASTTSDNGRPIQTRFPCGYGPEDLNRAADGNSPDHYAKGTPSRIAYAIALRPLVGTWFQVHIPPLTGVLLIFRSRYLFTIGHQGVFSLTGWSPSIQSRFHVTRPTQGTLRRQSTFAYGPVTLCGRPFQIVPLANCLITPVAGPTTPRWKPPRFGLFPVRSPLLRKSIFLSFPAVTKMFQFAAFAARTYVFSACQFGNPGIIACLTATPGLSQPSAPFKAS